MAIAFVAATSSQANSTTTNTTSAIDTTGANWLGVTITSNGGAVNFTSFTDSKGNTWQIAKDWTANGGGDSVRIMYAENPTVGSGHTFLLTCSSLGFTVVAVAAFSGMLTSGTLDKTASGTGTSTTLLTAATATTAQADELLIGCGTISDGANTTFTAGASYTIPTGAQQGNASIGTVGFLEYRIVSATGTYTSGASWGGASSAWVAAIATFKGAAAASGSLIVRRPGGLDGGMNSYTGGMR